MGDRVRRRGDTSVDVWSGDSASMADSDQVNHYGESNFHGDRGNLAILLFLYILQGLPMGLSAAIPMIMQNRGASYKQQVSNHSPLVFLGCIKDICSTFTRKFVIHSYVSPNFVGYFGVPWSLSL